MRPADYGVPLVPLAVRERRNRKMRGFLLARSALAQTAVVSLLSLVAVALLGLVLAYWTWVWFAPRSEPRLGPAAVPSGTLASAGTLFGSVPREQTTAAVPTGVAIRLLGVVAASSSQRGHAVVQIDAKQIQVVDEGKDVAPGIRLAEIHPEYVILERAGARERLALPQRRSSATPAARTVKK